MAAIENVDNIPSMFSAARWDLENTAASAARPSSFHGVKFEGFGPNLFEIIRFTNWGVILLATEITPAIPELPSLTITFREGYTAWKTLG
jgi:hypothetical protein